jgi:HPt (histidine-containing phosphotransfer) domain-containing protein
VSSSDKPSVRTAAAEQLLPRFIGHRARDVETIRRALRQPDFETIARLGHNMRGNGLSYGFPDIAAIGEAMETAANTGNPKGVLEHLAALEVWLARNSVGRERD